MFPGLTVIDNMAKILSRILEGVPVPARICLDRLPEKAQPKRRTAPFSKAWTEDKIGPEFLQEVIARWRRQR